MEHRKEKGGDVEVGLGNIGANIEALRKEKNMTQEELGQRIGLTPSAISNIERNKSAPSVDTLWRISDCFGVTIDSLFSVNIQKDLERLKLEEKLRTVERYLGNEKKSFSCNIGNRNYILECEKGNIKYQAYFVEET